MENINCETCGVLITDSTLVCLYKGSQPNQTLHHLCVDCSHKNDIEVPEFKEELRVKSQNILNDLFDVLPENQVATWDEDLKQYYVEYEKKGKKYKMWIENEKSIGEKINLAKKYNLAGIAFWEKDREPNTEFWTFVKEELN